MPQQLAAERYIGEHKEGRDDDGEHERPSEKRLQNDCQCIQVDSGDQHAGGGKGQGVKEVGGRIEPAAQVFRNAAYARTVVERHHYQSQKDHGGHGADPVEVDRGPAILSAVGGHTEDLDRP